MNKNISSGSKYDITAITTNIKRIIADIDSKFQLQSESTNINNSNILYSADYIQYIGEYKSITLDIELYSEDIADYIRIGGYISEKQDNGKYLIIYGDIRTYLIKNNNIDWDKLRETILLVIYIVTNNL